MSKHTPGPWESMGALWIWSPTAMANVAAVSALRATSHVEYTRPETGDKDRAEIAANARLIAAAPLLLDALRSALAGDQGWPAYAQDAIAKAEGK